MVVIDVMSSIVLDLLVFRLDSFVILFLIGLLSINVMNLKCVFFGLEVLFILECYYLILVEVCVINVFLFIF